jgi:hypothetical protein
MKARSETRWSIESIVVQFVFRTITASDEEGMWKMWSLCEHKRRSNPIYSSNICR